MWMRGAGVRHRCRYSYRGAAITRVTLKSDIIKHVYFDISEAHSSVMRGAVRRASAA